MARIRINDLPENQKITQEEMRQVLGGTTILDIQMQAFSSATDSMNDDKSYFLQKLSDMNDIAQAQADYLKSLMDAASSPTKG